MIYVYINNWKMSRKHNHVYVTLRIIDIMEKQITQECIDAMLP